MYNKYIYHIYMYIYKYIYIYYIYHTSYIKTSDPK